MFLALIVGAALALSAPGATLHAAPQTTIQFWNGHTGPDGPVMQGLVQAFQQTHPGIRIQVQTIAWDDLFTKAALAVANGSGPDLVTMPVDRLITYKDKLFKPIDDVASSFKADQFDAGLWALTRLSGHQYGIPLDTHPYVLYYRTDLFRAASLAAPPRDRPMSREEFLRYAHALTKGDQYGFGFKQIAVHAWWDTWGFFRQAGGALYSGNTKVLLDSPSMIEAVTYLQDLRTKERISPPDAMNWQTAFSRFTQGKIAMLIHGSWLVPALRQSALPWDTAMVPRLFTEGPYTAFANMHMFAFTRLNAERTAAALEFVKWVEQPTIASQWGAGAGNVPALLAARQIYARDPQLAPIARTAEMNGGRLFMAPYDPRGETLTYKVIVPGLEAIYQGNVPVGQGLADMAKQGNQIMLTP